jgi:hypothetical protein
MQDHFRPSGLRRHIFEVHRLDSVPELFLHGGAAASAGQHVASKAAAQTGVRRAIQEYAQAEQATE